MDGRSQPSSQQPCTTMGQAITESLMQLTIPPELEALVQQRLITGRYNSPIEVLMAGVALLNQQEDIYQGRLQDLQRDALIGWEAAQRGELVDGKTAMDEIRAFFRASAASH
jgi:antitoxin ParD1/3/4